MAVITVDFDGTLYQGDSFKAMFQAAKKDFTWKEWIALGFGVEKAVAYGVFKGKQAFKHSFFKSFARSFKGKTRQELDEFFETLVEARQEEVHKELVKKIHQHQKNGDQVIILSGALQPFLQAFIKKLKLDVHIISTELLFDEQGYCTGKIGPIINGEEKVQGIRQWLEHSAPSPDVAKEVWAYADSESDLQLLRYVDQPVVVNPDNKMKQIAAKNNWSVF